MAKRYDYPENPADTIRGQFEQIWRRGVRETEAFNENVDEFLNRIVKLENGAGAANKSMEALQEKTREINAYCLKLSHDKLNAVSEEMSSATTNFDYMTTPGKYYMEITSDITNYPNVLAEGDKILLDVIGNSDSLINQIVYTDTGKIIYRTKVNGWFGYWYVLTGTPIT